MVVDDSFPPYGALFRRRFGIDNEQALELFHQTVSMKSVGNLTDFVRSHMLEPFDVEPRIAALIAHFDDLQPRARGGAQGASGRSRCCSRWWPTASATPSWPRPSKRQRAAAEALQAYFAGLKAELLDKRLAASGDELARHDSHVERLTAQQREQQAQERELRRAIADSGGDRLERLALEIAQQGSGEAAPCRQGRALRRSCARSLGLLAVHHAETSWPSAPLCAPLREAAPSARPTLQNELTELGVALRKGVRSTTS